MAPIKRSLYSFQSSLSGDYSYLPTKRHGTVLCSPKVDYVHVDKLLDTVKVMS